VKGNMNQNAKMYCFIPARGGSKRIPRKNIRSIAGKALIQYTIEAAHKSLLFDQVIVSTDDLQIESLSRELGTKVIKRPPELSQDTSNTIDSVLHFIQEYNLKPEDIIILLQPTSPLRNEKHIIEAYNLFASSKSSSLVSVTKPEHSPYWNFKVKNKILIPIMDKKYIFMRSQDLPETYIPNGAIYIASTSTIIKERTFYCQDTLAYVMSRENSIDIDEEIDLQLAELLIRRRNDSNNNNNKEMC
jgi:CMP-N-acetylneuraminic acid synthetase